MRPGHSRSIDLHCFFVIFDTGVPLLNFVVAGAQRPDEDKFSLEPIPASA